jgi:hypothetical protein
VGQWVDCLDTVAQWLEARIVSISTDGSELFIHYNGWAVRECRLRGGPAFSSHSTPSSLCSPGGTSG